MPQTTKQPDIPAAPAPPIALPPDVEQALVALWPSLPQDQRKLWFNVLDVFLPPEAELLEQLEQLEDRRRLDARTPEDREIVPLEEVAARFGSKQP